VVVSTGETADPTIREGDVPHLPWVSVVDAGAPQPRPPL